ncbi:MAG: DUF937 domain-containing protein [Gemmatimonadota bacterium]
MSEVLGTVMAELDRPGALASIAAKLGVDETQARQAVESALPVLLGGLARNAQNGEGASSLLAALDKDHDGSVLDDIGDLLSSGGGAAGSGILGHIFGDRQGQVQDGLGQATGIGGQGMGQLLSMLAPLVMGALGRVKNQGGLDADGLQQTLNREGAAITANAPGLMQGMMRLLDRNQDGSALDDIAGMVGGLFRKPS